MILMPVQVFNMSCNKCTFIAHDPFTQTDWYLNVTDSPACLLCKYGDQDWEYEFYVFDAENPVPPSSDEPECIQRAWKYINS